MTEDAYIKIVEGARLALDNFADVHCEGSSSVLVHAQNNAFILKVTLTVPVPARFRAYYDAPSDKVAPVDLSFRREVPFTARMLHHDVSGLTRRVNGEALLMMDEISVTLKRLGCLEP